MLQYKTITFMVCSVLLFGLVINQQCIPLQYPRSALSQEQSIEQEMKKSPKFPQYKENFSKRYDSYEQQIYRYTIYNDNLRKIAKDNHNKQMTYNSTINEFADLPPQQFLAHYNNLYISNNYIINKIKNIQNIQENLQKNHICNSLNLSKINIQENDTEINKIKLQKQQYIKKVANNVEIKQPSFNNSINQNQQRLLRDYTNVSVLGVNADWSKYTGIPLHQGKCGSCYAFAAVNTVSALYSMYVNPFYMDLSVQQVVDCDVSGLTYGCNGGFIEGGFQTIKLMGITSQFRYPYTSHNGTGNQQCLLNKGSYKITKYKHLQRGNCTTLALVVRHKPVAVAIAAYLLQFYQGGIFNNCNTYIDHAVVVVGYRSGVGWKLKNSWGRKWGEGGYAWIADGNYCNICSNPVQAIIEAENK